MCKFSDKEKQKYKQIKVHSYQQNYIIFAGASTESLVNYKLIKNYDLIIN